VKFTPEQLNEEVEKFRNPEKGAEKVADDEGNVKTNKRAR
jgi:hypothetical protein